MKDKDEFAWWYEAIKDPKYRCRTWALMALASAFVGDEEKCELYGKLYERDKKLITT